MTPSPIELSATEIWRRRILTSLTYVADVALAHLREEPLTFQQAQKALEHFDLVNFSMKHSEFGQGVDTQAAFGWDTNRFKETHQAIFDQLMADPETEQSS